ncbi:MAG: HAD hydrolase-like protein [Acholeplasmataceae bacterium]|nr:HAD hydrolase-like protein [Acholeplasmataceae bacterium]
MKYIFWDFNGTILDDARLCFDILNEMLIEEERPTVTFEEYLMIFTFPVEAYYAKVYDLKKTPFKVLAHRFIDSYQPRSLKLSLHENAVDTIKHFEKMGYINILLSASEEKNLEEQLKHFEIRHLFQYVLGTSNVYAKSKVQVGKDFIEKMNIDTKNAVMVGDTLHDAEVAKELGMDIILFTKGHQHKERLQNYKNIDSFQDLIGKI